MEMYELSDASLMAGKKILYVHGFASSGNNGTVRTLRTLLPSAEIIAPDLPVEPSEAMALLEDICRSSDPDLIIGTSMGGMYAERLCGHYRILVNPAFHLGDSILKNNGLGRQEYHNKRENGETSFLVNKGLIESFRQCTSHCFESIDKDNLVWGLFGVHDKSVNTYDEFAAHYFNAIRFNGEHYLNDSAVLHALIPVIRRIEDIQEGRSRKIIFVRLQGTLTDTRGDAEQNSAKAFAKLSESYDVYALSDLPYNEPDSVPATVRWCEANIGVSCWNRIVFSSRTDLLLGDYLIDRHTDKAEEFMGTVIEFGSDTFRTWDAVLSYFEKLGGQ